MNDKLRECAHCGDVPERIEHVIHENHHGKSSVINCSNCGLTMVGRSDLKVMQTWNTRHEPKHKTVEQCCNNCRAISDCPLVWNRADWNLEEDFCSKHKNNHHGKPEDK